MTLAPGQTDHLFLLMGGNPLPNAVAALTLLQPGGTPHIIHTRQTQTQAQNLMALLTTTFGYQPTPLIDLDQAQAEAAIIRQQVQARATSLRGTVGMNYTGGTKPMSVHAYRALAEVCPQATFSYLDSNTSKITLDQDHGPSQQIALDATLSLGQLFQLHGLRWRDNQPPLTMPILPEAATQLAQLHQLRELAYNWRQWCNRSLLPLTKDRDYWLPEWQLPQVPPVPLDRLAAPLRDVLQTHLGADNTTLSLAVAPKLGFPAITDLCAWLDGIWLEHYTLAQVQSLNLAPETASQKLGLGFHIVQPEPHSPRYDKFEFDVAFMRGYHLFALSCTTGTTRKGCKQKLLEASIRSRQLGGSEARVALVCGYHRPEDLRAELEVMGRDKRVAVFGRQDWPQLGQKIAKWVKQNG
jgi:hypothetical protein